ncbi:hypothetical protein B0O99DRAFT_613860 [Bisporella sp. PMI_857]|nr:hypothetical protein B0O99DRAFT_613860 [Bisporella sp. PMI_857]
MSEDYHYVLSTNNSPQSRKQARNSKQEASIVSAPPWRDLNQQITTGPIKYDYDLSNPSQLIPRSTFDDMKKMDMYAMAMDPGTSSSATPNGRYCISSICDERRVEDMDGQYMPNAALNLSPAPLPNGTLQAPSSDTQTHVPFPRKDAGEVNAAESVPVDNSLMHVINRELDLDTMCQPTSSSHDDLCEKFNDLQIQQHATVMPGIGTEAALADRVMAEFQGIFGQRWSLSSASTTFIHAAGSSPQGSGSSRGSFADSGASHMQLFQSNKRQRIDNDEGDDEWEGKEGGDRGPQNTGIPPEKLSEEVTKLACPFRKHDPVAYGIHSDKYRICALSHWTTISRLKEHLYRCHRAAIHCNRCWQIFSDQQQLNNHLRAVDMCSLQPENPPDGITPEIESKLRSRKKINPKDTEENRWNEIYKLLFPQEAVPSPYFEPFQQEIWRSPESQELENYEAFARAELPRLVRADLEELLRQEMQHVEAKMLVKLVDVVQECQSRVFRLYFEKRMGEKCGSQQLEQQNNATSTREQDKKWTSDASTNLLTAAFEQPPLVKTNVYEASPVANNNLLVQNFVSAETIFSDSGYQDPTSCFCFGHGQCICTTQEQLRNL